LSDPDPNDYRTHKRVTVIGGPAPRQPESIVGSDGFAAPRPDLESPQPWQQEVIEPTRYDDVMAVIRVVTKHEVAATTKALEMLSRCADCDPIKEHAAFAELKDRSKFPLGTLGEMFAKFRKNAPAPAANVDPAMQGWRIELLRRDNGEPYGNLANVCTVLRGEPDFLLPDGSSVFELNEFTDFPMLHGPACWESAPFPKKEIGDGRPVTDDDVSGIAELVQRLGIPASETVVLSAVRRIAIVKKYHPVREFLFDCKESWDKTPRLDSLLPYYAGIDAGETPLTEKQLKLPRATGARFCIGAAARALQPGTKMDTALILEGIQGIGKSTFFEILFSEEFFSDHISDLGSKDSALEMAGVWGVELSELDAMGRAEVSRIKGFLSRRKDRFRAPYARTVGEHPRGCVFCGTTNENEYLRDATGGRRFWTHRSYLLRLTELKRDRVQLWGEAVARYDAGEKHWLHEADLIDDAAWESRERTVSDPWEDDIREFLRWRTVTTFKEIWEHLKIGTIDQDGTKKLRISNCLKRLNWIRAGQIRDGLDRPHTFKPKPKDREPGEDE
jgi:putative DNA primase/helicase